jgi:hypothetical protein
MIARRLNVAKPPLEACGTTEAGTLRNGSGFHQACSPLVCVAAFRQKTQSEDTGAAEQIDLATEASAGATKPSDRPGAGQRRYFSEYENGVLAAC